MHAERSIPYRKLVFILLAAFVLLTIRISAGWYGHHDENGRWISTAIRNYALYGADEVGYLVTTTPNPAAPQTLDYYVNHPPFIVWTGWLAAKLFGQYRDDMPYPDAWPQEMSVRLVSIFATMISLSAFYVMCRRLLGQKHALLCLLLYVFTPMIAYFGRMPNHEPLALPFIFLFVAIFINWMRRFSLARSSALAILAVIAMWTAWAAAFFFAALGFVALIYGRKEQRIAIILIGLITGLATLAIPLFYELQHTGAITELLNAFFFRTSSRTLGRSSASFTVGQFMLQVVIHMISAMTLGVISFGLWGFMWQVPRQKNLVRVVIFALLVAAIGYMLVFRNAFYVHDYYKIYFMPAFVIGASLAIYHLWTLPVRGIARFARPVVVAIMLISTLLGAFWFVILHRTGTHSPLAIVSKTLPELTQEQDIVFTNLADIHPSIDYYAYRTIRYGVNLENAQSQADDATQYFYLFCDIGAGDTEIYAELAADENTTILSDTCLLLDLE